MCLLFTGLMCIRDMDAEAFAQMEMPYSTPSVTGHDVPLSMKHSQITLENRGEYVRAALNYRYVDLLNTFKTAECNSSHNHILDSC